MNVLRTDQAIIEVGRINKTLYLLIILMMKAMPHFTQLNGRKSPCLPPGLSSRSAGEIRKRYTDGQEQLGTLGRSLTPSCYGTLFICRQPLIISGRSETLNDEDIARLSPLATDISICSAIILHAGGSDQGHLRPLKEASEAENVA